MKDSHEQRAKPGPKTARGKQRVANNARTHAIFAKIPVVPGLENPREWRKHLAGLIEGLHPEGYFERDLVKRYAELTWRLRRVTRYEVAVVEARTEAVTEEAETHLNH